MRILGNLLEKRDRETRFGIAFLLFSDTLPDSSLPVIRSLDNAIRFLLRNNCLMFRPHLCSFRSRGPVENQTHPRRPNTRRKGRSRRRLRWPRSPRSRKPLRCLGHGQLCSFAAWPARCTHYAGTPPSVILGIRFRRMWLGYSSEADKFDFTDKFKMKRTSIPMLLKKKANTCKIKQTTENT